MGRPNNCDCRCDNPIIIGDDIALSGCDIYSKYNSGPSIFYDPSTLEYSGRFFHNTPFTTNMSPVTIFDAALGDYRFIYGSGCIDPPTPSSINNFITQPCPGFTYDSSSEYYDIATSCYRFGDTVRLPQGFIFRARKHFFLDSTILGDFQYYPYVVSGITATTLPTEIAMDIHAGCCVDNPNDKESYKILFNPYINCCCCDDCTPESGNQAFFAATGMIRIPTDYFYETNCDQFDRCATMDIQYVYHDNHKFPPIYPEHINDYNLTYTSNPIPSSVDPFPSGADTVSNFNSFGIEFFMNNDGKGFTTFEARDIQSGNRPESLDNFFNDRLENFTPLSGISDVFNLIILGVSGTNYIRNEDIREFDPDNGICFDGSSGVDSYKLRIVNSCYDCPISLYLSSGLGDYEYCCQRFSQIPYGSGDGVNIDNNKPLYSLDINLSSKNFMKETYRTTQGLSLDKVLLYFICFNDDMSALSDCNFFRTFSYVLNNNNAPSHALIYPLFEEYPSSYINRSLTCDSSFIWRCAELPSEYVVLLLDSNNMVIEKISIDEFNRLFLNNYYYRSSFFTSNCFDKNLDFNFTVTAYEIDKTDCYQRYAFKQFNRQLNQNYFQNQNLMDVLYRLLDNSYFTLPEHQIELYPNYFFNDNNPYYLEYHLINNSGLIPDTQHLYIDHKCSISPDLYFQVFKGTHEFTLEYVQPDGDGNPYDFPFGVFSSTENFSSICNNCYSCYENDLEDQYLGLVISGVYSEDNVGETIFITDPYFACVNTVKYATDNGGWNLLGNSLTSWLGCG